MLDKCCVQGPTSLMIGPGEAKLGENDPRATAFQAEQF
jgi:hypothetical protein